MCDELLYAIYCLECNAHSCLYLNPFISSRVLFVIRELLMWAWLSQKQGTLSRGPEPQWGSQANGAVGAEGGGGSWWRGDLAGGEVPEHPGHMARQAWALGGPGFCRVQVKRKL